MNAEILDNARREEWIALARRVGYGHAVGIIAAGDMSHEWMFAELIIAFAAGRERGQQVRVWYDVAPVANDENTPAGESVSADDYSDDWLLEGKPEGTVVPPASGRENFRTPNLNSANPSFAAKLILYVRDKFGGDAPFVYRAAHVSRKTYSAIISNELRPVSKQVAVAFAFALQLPLSEAKDFLRSAGHAFSDFMLEDIIYQACLIAGIYDIHRVNQILTAHNANPLSCQDEPSKCLHGGDNSENLQPEGDFPF